MVQGVDSGARLFAFKSQLYHLSCITLDKLLNFSVLLFLPIFKMEVITMVPTLQVCKYLNNTWHVVGAIEVFIKYTQYTMLWAYAALEHNCSVWLRLRQNCWFDPHSTVGIPCKRGMTQVSCFSLTPGHVLVKWERIVKPSIHFKQSIFLNIWPSEWLNW